MCNVGFAGGEGDAVDLTLAREAKEAPASDVGVAPVAGCQRGVQSWSDGEGAASPGQEGGTLEEGPVGGAVELEDAESGVR